eukprot:CAMPEP_0197531380 /NCGR_PEP_ID=MMETSP1318-20131121/35375_1 /TAXON_ID=552666 /ORGANISM="Partenskyella glossopodia, Strain RCC365" /LENGTH=502 /DNA_ID=CAMNT_0043087573 /DNA_START=30 /DNA_END=1535 /DNA_ORIENTATION=+
MVSITKHLAELKLGSLGCLTTQLITCLVLMTVVHSMLPSHCPELAVKHGKDSRILQIQEELKSYRVHLETEAELLKKINNYQRIEENHNAALSSKDLVIEQLKEDLYNLELKYNSSKNNDNEGKDDNKDNENDEDGTKAGKKSLINDEKAINISESKNETWMLPNQLTREAAPVGYAVAIVADENAKELQKTIDSLTKALPATGFPVFVSQFGDDQKTSEMIQAHLMNKEGSRLNIFHLQFPIQDTDTGQPRKSNTLKTESGHVNWVLSTLFDKYGYSKVILMDEYLDIAFDFFDYFQATASLLDSDPSIMCVSAWNENGQADYAKDSGALLRTDIFPDFASMIDTDFWREIKSGWPATDWKQWLRNREGGKGSSCVIPEVCRVSARKKPIMSKSDEQFYEQYLSRIKLNKNTVSFDKMDLGFLKASNYNAYIAGLIADSTEVGSATLLKEYRGKPGDLKLAYKDTSEYLSIARTLSLTNTLKAGRPTSSYYGVVTIRYGTW